MSHYLNVTIALKNDQKITSRDRKKYLYVFFFAFTKTKFWEKSLQAALVIRGLFICGNAYSRSMKIYQNSEFADFPSRIRVFLQLLTVNLA
jgi:hypothetical protein